MSDDKPALRAKDFLEWPAWAIADWYISRGLKLTHKLRMALEREGLGATFPEGMEEPS